MESVKELDINVGLQAFSKVSQVLEGLKEKYTGLVVNGTADKEGYEAIREAKSVLVSTRTSVDPIRKALTENARKYTSDVNEEARRIVSYLEAIELPITEEKKRIDELIAKEKQDKVDADLHEYNRRINECLANGMEYLNVADENGQEIAMYVIGTIKVKPSQIRVSATEKFDNFLLAVKAANAVKQEEKEAIRILEETEKQKEALLIVEKSKELEIARKEQALVAEEQEKKAQWLSAEQEKLAQEIHNVKKAQWAREEQERTKVANNAIIKEHTESDEPVRSQEEAVTENTYHRSVTDRAKLDQFARYISFNMPDMVPVVHEEWAVPIAEKMREQFVKMAAYINERLPVQS